MIKLRVVIDTNILISASLFKGSLPDRTVRAIFEQHLSLASDATYAELERKLLHQKFDRYASRSDRLNFLHMYFLASERVDVTTSITACRDPEDNKFLELALDGEADVIITGDDDLLILHPFRGIDVLTPRDFLQSAAYGSLPGSESS